MKQKPFSLRKLKSILEMVSLLTMAASFILFGYIYKAYPSGNTYQTHIFVWILDDNKSILLLPLFISAGVMSFLFLIYRFPKLYKYPQTITAENIEMQYHLAKIMISTELILSAVFSSAVYIIMYYTAIGIPWQTDWLFLLLLPAAAILVFTAYIKLAKKYK